MHSSCNELASNGNSLSSALRWRNTRILHSFLLVVCCGIPLAQRTTAQDAAGPAPKADPSTESQTEFAPGVVTVIPPAPDPKETYDGPMTLKSIIDAHPEIAWEGTGNHPEGKPHFEPRSRTLQEMLKQVILRREIYCFEFSFKPLRQMYLDIPRPDGRMQRKLVHYMVYRVRYQGGDLRPAADDLNQPIFRRIEAVSYNSRRLFPMLILEDHESNKQYTDQILPTAIDRIAIREQITAPLYNSVDISTVKIPRTRDEDAPGVWGVATWVDLDPNLDFFSVHVFGLTNAFEQVGEGPDAPYTRKTLSLNFFRPGDAVNQTADRTRFGVPAYDDEKEQKYVLEKYGLDKRLDYRWIFR